MAPGIVFITVIMNIGYPNSQTTLPQALLSVTGSMQHHVRCVLSLFNVAAVGLVVPQLRDEIKL